MALPKLYSQECEVGVEALKGKYEGACKKGKADGKGKATGIDIYEGEFRSGLPEGKGKYTWASGSWYEGEWQKGKRAGKGDMHYMTSHGDSVITGFWKKDEYIGLYEKPYEIISRGSATNLEVRLVKNDTRNEINLSVGQVLNQVLNQVKPVLNNVVILKGSFGDRIDNTSALNKNSYAFKQVSFPFRAVFTFGNGSVEVEFYQAGSYLVDISY